MLDSWHKSDKDITFKYNLYSYKKKWRGDLFLCDEIPLITLASRTFILLAFPNLCLSLSQLISPSSLCATFLKWFPLLSQHQRTCSRLALLTKTASCCFIIFIPYVVSCKKPNNTFPSSFVYTRWNSSINPALRTFVLLPFPQSLPLSQLVSRSSLCDLSRSVFHCLVTTNAHA